MADGRAWGQSLSGIAIYMEGGGEGNATKAALRQGMDTFLQPLKEAARDKMLPWKLVCCGPRNEAFKRFQNAVRCKGGTRVESYGVWERAVLSAEPYFA